MLCTLDCCGGCDQVGLRIYQLLYRLNSVMLRVMKKSVFKLRIIVVTGRCANSSGHQHSMAVSVRC